MFERVMTWLSKDSILDGPEFEDNDIRLATAALFYHVIAADGRIRPVERAKFRTTLRERFDLDRAQLDALEQQGQEADINSPGVFPFTVILNRGLDQGERERVFAYLESLAMADGFLHELERDFLEHVKMLLKLGR